MAPECPSTMHSMSINSGKCFGWVLLLALLYDSVSPLHWKWLLLPAIFTVHAEQALSLGALCRVGVRAKLLRISQEVRGKEKLRKWCVKSSHFRDQDNEFQKDSHFLRVHNEWLCQNSMSHLKKLGEWLRDGYKTCHHLTAVCTYTSGQSYSDSVYGILYWWWLCS